MWQNDEADVYGLEGPLFVSFVCDDSVAATAQNQKNRWRMDIKSWLERRLESKWTSEFPRFDKKSRAEGKGAPRVSLIHFIRMRRVAAVC